MQPIKSLSSQVFVNEQTQAHKVKPGRAVAESQDSTEKPHNNYVKSADKATLEALDEVFSRANSFSDISASAQRSVSAYHDVQVSDRREAVSQLFGVDLYA